MDIKKAYISKENISIRMFESAYLEYFTHIPPHAPHAVFVPVVLLMFYWTIHIPLTFFQTLYFLLLGLIFWTLTEYTMHRFVFHMHPQSKIAQKLQWLLHGVHHDYPQDATRLVMPLQVSIPLTILFYYLFKLFLGNHHVFPFFAGFIIGYLIYDTLHYVVHHIKLKNKTLLKIKSRHMNHHFVDPDHNFHVSCPLWDFIFKTYKR